MSKISKNMLGAKLLNSRSKLIRDLTYLSNSLQYEVDKMNSNEKYIPNSCGIIQGDGLRIDMECSKLYELTELYNILNFDEED